VHVQFAAVHANACGLCGLPPFAAPARGSSAATAATLGLPCRRSGCSGVTSDRCGWEASCVVDDGTSLIRLFVVLAVFPCHCLKVRRSSCLLRRLLPRFTGSAQAVVRADGAAAVALLALPVAQRLSLEATARASHRQLNLTAPPPPGQLSPYAAALAAAKGRVVLACCLVVGSRLQASLAPLQSAQAAAGLAAGFPPVAAPSGRGLANGWACDKCKNRNFPSRTACNSCGAAMPATVTKAHSGCGGSSSSVALAASTVEAGGVKWTTATLPRLELKCFHAEAADARLEARLKLMRLTQGTHQLP
jgi:hypothetical protein